jgi:MoxR-like ATPase
MLATLEPAITPDELSTLQAQARAVHVADALLDYTQALLRHSREAAEFHAGLSPRAGLALVHAAQAWAMMDGRDAVLPEDVQAVGPGVFSHRLRGSGEYADTDGDTLAAQLLNAVAVP